MELTNNQPDFREQVDIWSEHPVKDSTILPKYLRLHRPNQSLPDSILPNYEKTVNEWFAAVGHLADALMGLLALGLELPQHYFDQRFGEERMSFAKLIPLFTIIKPIFTTLILKISLSFLNEALVESHFYVLVLLLILRATMVRHEMEH